MIRYRAPRRGFTLVELLMVITILALLAALTAAGIGRVRNAQLTRTSESTVQKLQKALDENRIAVLDEATKDTNPYLPAVTSFCDNDKDRAKALLAYLYAKREFPQTFAEAAAGVTIPGVGPLPRHKAFASLPAASGFTDDSPLGLTAGQKEAAVLLYLIVTEKGNRGMVFANDDALRGAETTIGSFKAYKDAWGMPVTFLRWYGPGVPELQQAPYVNAKATAFDPFDRQGFDGRWKLQNWTNAANKTTALAILNAPVVVPPVPPTPAVGFDGLNKVITAVSAGEDKNMTTPDDNIFGYRLARFGNRGD